jgi:hypothetical protein
MKNYKNEPNFFVNDSKDTLDKFVKRDGYGETEFASYLAQKTGKDPEDLYFDGNDLVYGSKTIVRGANRQTVDKLLAKLKTIRSQNEEVESNLQEKVRTYTVIHIKKGKEIIKTSKGTYDAALQYAKMKGLKNTVGVDVHLMEEIELDEKEINYDGKGPIKMSKKEYASVNKFQKSMIRGKPYVMALNTKTQGTELVPVVFEAVELDEKEIRHDGKGPIKMSKKEYDKINKFRKGDIRGKPHVMATIKKGGFDYNMLVPVIFEEVDDNSIMARATRLISQTAIREKIDPADIDMKATDLDRKAADKNIFIQLKRAQDMKGKTDVEFLDKKKQKVDIRVINKALDMFDKMKPNDKLKMQTAIGKSYRDLLKVVQRGKV